MNVQILKKNLTIKNYHLKKDFYLTSENGKREKGDGHISNDKYLHLKNVWIPLILKILQILIIITLKNMYCYQLMYLKSLQIHV